MRENKTKYEHASELNNASVCIYLCHHVWVRTIHSTEGDSVLVCELAHLLLTL